MGESQRISGRDARRRQRRDRSPARRLSRVKRRLRIAGIKKAAHLSPYRLDINSAKNSSFIPICFSVLLLDSRDFIASRAARYYYRNSVIRAMNMENRTLAWYADALLNRVYRPLNGLRNMPNIMYSRLLHLVGNYEKNYGN